MQSRRSRGPHDATGGRMAGKNGKFNSGKGEPSSRRARCRKSGRRAAMYRRANEEWTAYNLGDTNLNQQFRHTDILRIMGDRTISQRQRITEEEIQRRLEADRQFQEQNDDMYNLQMTLDLHTDDDDVPALGHIPKERGDGVFRFMSVQLNGIATSRSRNTKAALLQHLIRQYDIQLVVGMAEVGINWSKAQHGKRLLSLVPSIEAEARSTLL